MNESMKSMPRLKEVLEELRAREPVFHRPESGSGPADGEHITEATFWEVGASGRVYRRDEVLEILGSRQKHPPHESWEASEFECHPLAPNLYLLGYRLRLGDRHTRRTTLWRRTADGWKVVFHQGTVCAEA